MFPRIVPASTSQNVASLAPLTVIRLVYGLGGALIARAIRWFFWVPHRFRYGILAAGATVGVNSGKSWRHSYVGCPIAMGITASAPFGGVDDENLAIAYISMLVLIFLVRLLSLARVIRPADALKITLFPLGGYLLISKDFEGPDVDSKEDRERIHVRHRSRKLERHPRKIYHLPQREYEERVNHQTENAYLDTTVNHQ
jgi:hypothetical protein